MVLDGAEGFVCMCDNIQELGSVHFHDFITKDPMANP
jgi:hypothetical protein